MSDLVVSHADAPSGNMSLQSCAERQKCLASLSQAAAFHSSFIICPPSPDIQLNMERVRWSDEYSWT